MTDIQVDYTVDTGVPVPVRTMAVPVGELGVGESVLFPIEKRPTVQSRASKLKKSRGMEFTIKKVSDTECRVWRTK